IDDPSPAPDCTRTSCPCVTSSCTPAGVIATRNSLFFTSAGTATFIQSAYCRKRRISPPFAGQFHGFREYLVTEWSICSLTRRTTAILRTIGLSHYPTLLAIDPSQE